MSDERRAAYLEFRVAARKRREAFQRYERANRHWWQVFSLKAHRTFNEYIEALDVQNSTTERLNDIVEREIRDHN